MGLFKNLIIMHQTYPSPESLEPSPEEDIWDYFSRIEKSVIAVQADFSASTTILSNQFLRIKPEQNDLSQLPEIITSLVGTGLLLFMRESQRLRTGYTMINDDKLRKDPSLWEPQNDYKRHSEIGATYIRHFHLLFDYFTTKYPVDEAFLRISKIGADRDSYMNSLTLSLFKEKKEAFIIQNIKMQGILSELFARIILPIILPGNEQRIKVTYAGIKNDLEGVDLFALIPRKHGPTRKVPIQIKTNGSSRGYIDLDSRNNVILHMPKFLNLHLLTPNLFLDELYDKWINIDHLKRIIPIDNTAQFKDDLWNSWS